MLPPAPSRLTEKASNAYRDAVHKFVSDTLDQHGVKAEVRVKVGRSNGKVYAGVKIVDADGTAAQHYPVSRALKAEGFGTALLWHWSEPSNDPAITFLTSASFYPMTPDAPHPFPELVKG